MSASWMFDIVGTCLVSFFHLSFKACLAAPELVAYSPHPLKKIVLNTI
jgi:hypothetical protein